MQDLLCVKQTCSPRRYGTTSSTATHETQNWCLQVVGKYARSLSPVPAGLLSVRRALCCPQGPQGSSRCGRGSGWALRERGWPRQEGSLRTCSKGGAFGTPSRTRGGEGWPVADDFVSCACLEEPQPKGGLGSVAAGAHAKVQGGWRARRGSGSCVPSRCLALCISRLAVPELYPS